MNLTQVVSKLADNQIEAYSILKLLADVVYQHEEAIGTNPSAEKFNEILSRIDAAQRVDPAILDEMVDPPYYPPAAPTAPAA